MFVQALGSSKQELRLMGGALLYNAVRAHPKGAAESEADDSLLELVAPLCEALQNEQDSECAARLALALFELVYCNSSLGLVLVSMEVCPLDALRSRFSKHDKLCTTLKDIDAIVAFEKKQMETA
jgi:hypothetical protein